MPENHFPFTIGSLGVWKTLPGGQGLSMDKTGDFCNSLLRLHSVSEWSQLGYKCSFFGYIVYICPLF